jgi:transcriptional regulator with XRE-family HTH domain
MPGDINAVFAKRLKLAREMRKLSQEQLAAKSGLVGSAISHFETNSRKPSFDNLAKLVDALDVTADYLMGRTDSPQAPTSNSQIAKDYATLSERDKAVAKSFMATLVTCPQQQQ